METVLLWLALAVAIYIVPALLIVTWNLVIWHRRRLSQLESRQQELLRRIVDLLAERQK